MIGKKEAENFAFPGGNDDHHDHKTDIREAVVAAAAEEVKDIRFSPVSGFLLPLDSWLLRGHDQLLRALGLLGSFRGDEWNG